ncbi:MAG: DTW domain-containing protein [Treponema sp.]|nr:DTW domain-containing protein [Treponema sp.]
MRQICYQCLRPIQNCFCTYLTPFDPGVKFVFLMHPKEAKRQRTGTGRIAHAGLIDSEIIVGIDFTQNERLCALLSDEQYVPMLLYPGDDAWTANKDGFFESLGGRKLLVIVIDSTWFCSKKMIQFSTNIMALPKLSFSGNYQSIFTFKREPKPEYISTIESCYYLIKELQSAGVVRNHADPECLMTAFKAMIQFQLQKENDRIEGRIPNTHHHDYKYTRKKEIPTF